MFAWLMSADDQGPKAPSEPPAAPRSSLPAPLGSPPTDAFEQPEETRPLALAPIERPKRRKRGAFAERLEELEDDHEAIGRMLEGSVAALRALRKELEEETASKRATGDLERRRTTPPRDEEETDG